MSEEFINVNLEDVDDGREPIPDGVYHTVIKTVEMRKKEGGEYPYFNVEMKPAPGSVDPKLQNKSLFLTLSLHPKALWNMKAFFKALRMPLDLRGQRPDEICRSLAGRELRVSVGTRTDNSGEKQNEVKPPYHVVG